MKTIAIVVLLVLAAIFAKDGVTTATCPDDGRHLMWVGTEYRNTMQCRNVDIYQCMLCGKK